LTFDLDSIRGCKELWRCFVDNIGFYRLMRIYAVKEPPTTLVQYISAIVVRFNGGGCTVLHSKV